MHDGAAALFITCPLFLYTQAIRYETIAGYTFSFGDGQPLSIYKNGDFADLARAYDNGWIAEETVYEFFCRYTERRSQP